VDAVFVLPAPGPLELLIGHVPSVGLLIKGSKILRTNSSAPNSVHQVEWWVPR